ncbi:MAG: hypothetical protein OEW30_18920 [Acidimicrobiia bacterium]|nr:hypothetical protein [Acidimicrobiia bacterium]
MADVTLHEEIADILRQAGNAWTSTQVLASAVDERGRYRKRDGSPVDAFQIHGRTKNYPHLFEREGSLVRLRDPDDLGLPSDSLGRDDWDLAPGDTIRRIDLHHRYGGTRQGGVSPSASTPNIFLFTDLNVGAAHGYFDRWDGTTLHYTGEGQRGDQQMARGNKAILTHADTSKSLRVFEGSGGEVTYLGEMAVDPVDPWYTARAPETDGGPLRDVIMFRLVPIGPLFHKADTITAGPNAQPTLNTPYVPVDESSGIESISASAVDPDIVDRGVKGHKAIQNAVARYLDEHGVRPQRPGPGDPGFDLGWWSAGTFFVCEVKSLTHANETGQMRLGIGQVLDYAHTIRAAGHEVQAVLAVESAPTSEKWDDLCTTLGILLVRPGALDRLQPNG